MPCFPEAFLLDTARNSIENKSQKTRKYIQKFFRELCDFPQKKLPSGYDIITMARSRRYLEEALKRAAFLFSFGKAPDFFGMYEIYDIIS
ncbi:hypothetical protein [Neglectibacter caecimuris]|uniref:hypothetical protein n=1 Tax=Neglectibacter caecimuris TaxID=3093658 RepID=UPI002AC8A13E|nr:hypothetical protein [Neglectibacter sp. M00184]